MKKGILNKMSDQDLKYILQRIGQRFGSDLSDLIEVFQKVADVDDWLRTAKSSEEFFKMLNALEEQVQIESRKRFGYENRK